MALIGNWGDFTFYVSADQIKTFDSLKWDSAAKYSTHDRHLREPLLEFTGTDVETITFTMFFSVFLGVNPIKEIASLLQAMRRGEVNRLVIGPKATARTNGHYEAVKFLEAVRPMGQPACRVGECYDAVLRSQIRRAGNGIYRESLYARQTQPCAGNAGRGSFAERRYHRVNAEILCPTR